MSALAQSLQTKQFDNSQVTAISSVARVDYILRFSKHAVVVVDENSSEYSAVGSQFLANLSVERNAAYLTVSTKLDDVQIRCRLVEQLFGQVLFDPEQSLAVSVVNLLKLHQQPLTIVVEHAHHLSFQLLHELCQLAEIGKKASLDIQVVMLAQPEVAIKMNQHTLLFHKKLSIISAVSGQLIPLSDKSFQYKKSSERYAVVLKWLAAFMLLVVISAVVIYQLYQMETFKFSQLPVAAETTVQSKSVETSDLAALTITDDKAVTKKEEQIDVVGSNANPIDIYQALSGVNGQELQKSVDNTITEKVELPAAPIDIIQSLSVSFAQPEPAVTPIETTLDTESEVQISPSQNSQEVIAEQKEVKEPSAFANQEGLVIQLSVVSDSKVIEQLRSRLKVYGVLTYDKLVGNKTMTVFTSPIFETRQQAESFRQTLPEEFASGGGFIKSLSAIKAEISAFERSQSDANQVTIPTS